MSDWLERDLARGLTRVAAPGALGERLGLVRPRRSEYRGAVLAVAAAVVLIVAGGYAASRSTALDLYRYTARDAAAAPIELASISTVSLVSWNAREGAALSPRCDGGAGVNAPLRRGNTSALLAHHAGAEDRVQTSGDAGCRFCHSL